MKWAILLDRKIKNPWKYSIKWKTNFIKDKHLISEKWLVHKKNRDREFFLFVFFYYSNMYSIIKHTIKIHTSKTYNV